MSVSYRCWPQERYLDVRKDIRRLATSYAGVRAMAGWIAERTRRAHGLPGGSVA
ncbi:hypothetical protein [Streptomyces decoyicus]|uniref:hypothetical protein n=1 Tax=Streptomyces decoyicus TaxID=249567 RepID=UPI003F4C9166